MEGSELTSTLELSSNIVAKAVDAVASLLEHVTHLDERVRELAEDVAELGVKLTASHELACTRDRELERHIAAVDERLTTVHRQALRALNLTTGTKGQE